MERYQNYYAVIPANVRYDKSLPPNAKLLYGEITALCNKGGHCWASNAYFANLYGVSKKSISTWISALVKGGYISAEIVHKGAAVENSERHIRICVDGMEENVTHGIKSEGGMEEIMEGYTRKCKGGIEEKVTHNNTLNNTHNNTLNNKKEIYKEKATDKIPKKHKYGEYNNVLLTDEELEKLKDRFWDWENKIENLSTGIEMKGYKYKNHYLAILKWAERENNSYSQPKPPGEQIQRIEPTMGLILG